MLLLQISEFNTRSNTSLSIFRSGSHSDGTGVPHRVLRRAGYATIGPICVMRADAAGIGMGTAHE